MVGVLEIIPNTPGGVLILDQPNDLCRSFQGGAFITKECQLAGILVAKPTKLSNVVFSLPIANQVGIQCVQFAGTGCARTIKGII